LNAIRIIAKATREGGEKLDALIPLSDESREVVDWISSNFEQGGIPQVVIDNNPENDPLFKSVVDYFGGMESSLMVLFLNIEEEFLGSLALQANGNGRFSEDHMRLYTLLKEPMSIAVSNARKHLETVRLKDLLAEDNRFLHREMHRISGNRIIGEDFGLKSVMEMVHNVARHDSPVLLLGETGVGKDVIANAVHYASLRRDEPLITVNCGAIPGNLIDSELFGHEKGAFTGALMQKRGRFERADKGTIFLDEIGELPPEAQVRLLRVLQNKEIERVGGAESIPVNIRVIAATNRNLEAMVKAGTFREDLWFRLNVFPIFIPPLRERRSDIPALADYFLDRKIKELKLPKIPELAENTINTLISYDWPGNVRELENIIERALILSSGEAIDFKNLLSGKVGEPDVAEVKMPVDLPEYESLIRDYFQKVLKKSDGRINGTGGAAELVGLNPSTLRNKLRKLKIEFGTSKGSVVSSEKRT
jgi:formate hydrogenlyase transcriptional activator